MNESETRAELYPSMDIPEPQGIIRRIPEALRRYYWMLLVKWRFSCSVAYSGRVKNTMAEEG